MTKNQDLTTWNAYLGTLTLGVVLAMFVLAPIMGWEIPRYIATLLVISYLSMLGLGHMATLVAGGGNNNNGNK